MSRFAAAASAIGLAAIIALPAMANASERSGDGMKTSNLIEVSSVNRHHRHHGWRHHGWRHYGWRHRGWWPHRHYGWRHRYYRPYYGYYAPYRAYAYDPYYYRRGPGFYFGPFGFGFRL